MPTLHFFASSWAGSGVNTVKKCYLTLKYNTCSLMFGWSLCLYYGSFKENKNIIHQLKNKVSVPFSRQFVCSVSSCNFSDLTFLAYSVFSKTKQVMNPNTQLAVKSWHIEFYQNY